MRAVGRGAGESTGAGRASAQPAFELTESKLRPPAPRPGIVHRAGLLDRLAAGPPTPVISVVAPAGYGKTTLLAQWAERCAPRAAWVSVDDRDNDPAVLLAHLVAAIDRIEPIDPGIYGALAAASAAVTVPRRLVRAIAAMDQPVAIVLDHVEALTNPECQDAVTNLALGLPPGSQVAIGSRDRLPLPAARLHAQGGIIEIGPGDLAMDEREAPALLAGAGVDLPDDDVRDLVRRTEGWPAGLYLAALAVSSAVPGSPRPDAALTFPDDDRFVGDYLRAEILDRASPAEASFLTRTSILEAMSGPLCDATLAVRGSRQRLEDLEDRNLLVVPLDHRREWYRYHHLFRALLAAELRRREPEIVPDLHLRAAEWCEAHGQPEIAIDHAQAAEDADGVARLVLALANDVWSSGRADTVHRWLQWFDDRGLAERYPGIAVHGALMLALMGRPGDTERWALAAERAPATGTLPDGNTVEAMVAYMRAILARDGVERMRLDARAALDGLAPGSAYRATMLHTEGVSYLLEGDPERADPPFARALAVAEAAGMLPFVPLVLAERGIAALARDDVDMAAALTDRGGRDHGAAHVRRLLDERPRLRLARPGGPRTGRRRRRARARRSGGPAAAPADARAAGRVGTGPDRDGPRVRRARRRRGRPGRAAPGAGHLPSAPRPRSAAGGGRRSAESARHVPRRGAGRVVADDRRAAAAAAAADPPHVSGDR